MTICHIILNYFEMSSRWCLVTAPWASWASQCATTSVSLSFFSRWPRRFIRSLCPGSSDFSMVWPLGRNDKD